MKMPEPPKVKVGKPRIGKRSRYWNTHEMPTRKILKVPAMQKRLHAESVSLTSIVAELGSRSDVAVLKMRPAELVHNRAFAEHQQRLNGAIQRFAKHEAWKPMPTRIAAAHQKAAYLAMEDNKR